MKKRFCIKSCDENIQTDSSVGLIYQKDGTFAPDRENAKLYILKSSAERVSKKLYKTCVVEVHIEKKE